METSNEPPNKGIGTTVDGSQQEISTVDGSQQEISTEESSLPELSTQEDPNEGINMKLFNFSTNQR